MRLSDIGRWGFPSRLLDVWAERQGPTLLPVQSRAVRRGLLGSPEQDAASEPVRMIIAAPTSSGKSFCAELAAVRQIMARRRAVWLLPLKSLVEQKYRRFEATVGRLGIRTLAVDADHPENDRRFSRGDYQIAFAVYEKLDALLSRRLDTLANIGLIVVDELQTVAEPGRGAGLERLLTKVRASTYRPSLLGLSAVIDPGDDGSADLAAWLDAEVVEESRRPVDLLRGVAAEGSFRYRSYNSGLEDSEPFVERQVDRTPFDTLVEFLKRQMEPTLVFLKSRRETVEAALRLAGSVKWPSAEQAILTLSDLEPSYLTRSLGQALRRGVAFHNSDLSPSERAVVEQAFCDERVRVVFSTTTLSMGVDLPARTVLLETVKYASGSYGDTVSLVPVSRAEFDNMTGRAGRLGPAGDGGPGRAVILADNEFDREVLWKSYIDVRRPETVRSALHSMSPEDWLLNMAAAGLICSYDDIGGVWRKTLAGQREPCPGREFIDASVRLVDTGIMRSDGRLLTVTELGREAALSFLSFNQIQHYIKVLDEPLPDTEFGWIALALGAPDWPLPPGILSSMELADGGPVRVLFQQQGCSPEQARFLVNGRNLRRRLSRRSAAALKALLLMDQWRVLTPLQELEQRFRMHSGQISSLGETTAHLLNGLAALVGVLQPDTPQAENLRGLAWSVRHGLPLRLRELHGQFSAGLHRGDLAALVRAGLDSIPELARASTQDIVELLGSECKAQYINRIVEELKKEVEMSTNPAITEKTIRGAAIADPGYPQLIEIEGDYDRERYLVRINGRPIRLTGKSFKYLARLAYQRLYGRGGWVFKEDLEAGFNQARYLYRMKSEINDGFPTSWPIIENNRLGYYRLALAPERIRINMDKIREHPDYEVRSLAESEFRSEQRAN